MTTIAVDARTRGVVELCSDNLETSSWKAPCQKLYKVTSGKHKGDWIGTTGASSSSMVFVEYWKAGTEHDFKDFFGTMFFDYYDDDEIFECLLIKPNGGIFWVDRLFIPEDTSTGEAVRLYVRVNQRVDDCISVGQC